MDENLQPYDYYYANESSQYKFYQLPKELFDNPRYENLSDGAKILYGLMLDRMSLSRKNGWIDNEEKVYIIFTLESIMSAMKCKHDKAVKMLAELDSGKKDKNGKILIKGVRLIERKKQGQGNPSLIYLRKFFTAKGADNAEVKTSESPQSRLLENRSQEFGKTEVKTSEIPTLIIMILSITILTISILFLSLPKPYPHKNETQIRKGKEQKRQMYKPLIFTAKSYTATLNMIICWITSHTTTHGLMKL